MSQSPLTPDSSLMKRMSGRAFLEAMLAGEIDSSSISKLMNFHLCAVDDGMASFRGTPSEDNANLFGGVHGGWYATILDSCTACAIMTGLPQGRYQTTLELKINTIRPLRPGLQVEATGTAQHIGRTTGVAAGELRGVEDGKLYATASTTCMILTV